MTAPKCPTCRQPLPSDDDVRDAAHGNNNAWRPFCSERCKLIDLQKWLGGVFAIPGKPIVPNDNVN